VPICEKPNTLGRRINTAITGCWNEPSRQITRRSRDAQIHRSASPAAPSPYDPTLRRWDRAGERYHATPGVGRRDRRYPVPVQPANCGPSLESTPDCCSRTPIPAQALTALKISDQSPRSCPTPHPATYRTAPSIIGFLTLALIWHWHLGRSRNDGSESKVPDRLASCRGSRPSSHPPNHMQNRRKVVGTATPMPCQSPSLPPSRLCSMSCMQHPSRK
jgi:hypothetical protein